MDEFEAVDDRADGAAAFFGDLGDGQFLDEVEFENGRQARVLAAAAGVEIIEHEADAAGEVLVGSLGHLWNKLGKKN